MRFLNFIRIRIIHKPYRKNSRIAQTLKEFKFSVFPINACNKCTHVYWRVSQFILGNVGNEGHINKQAEEWMVDTPKTNLHFITKERVGGT